MVAVWGALSLLVVAVFVTYVRLPAGDLYAVSHDGLVGGASRVLVLLGYPVSLVAIATLGFVVDRARLAGATFQRGVTILALVALALCASVVVPGVIDPDDLDAKPVNALAAIGVLLALALAGLVARRTGVGSFRPWTRWDWLPLAFALALLFAAIPWLAADLGLSVDETPVLGRIFLGDELVTHAAEPEPAPAVHRGHHHGMDGVLFALAALLLLRELPAMRRSGLRAASAVYLSLALVYGLANAVEDGWLEQIVKRGDAEWGLPNVIRPGVSWSWAGIVLGAVAVATVVVSFLRRADGGERAPAGR